jgi:23S rRNA G2069 N7-methylase RlmK/C1962 C5-methylase RlmI
MFRNRLIKSFRHLRKWAQKANRQGYRLYNRDIPEYPYQVDFFGNFAIVYEKGLSDVPEQLRSKKLGEIFASLVDVLDLDEDHIFLKQRFAQGRNDKYQKKALGSALYQVYEGPAKFEINASDYMDYGLFLDHAPLRRMIFEMSAGKTILNLFAYTCSFGVFAALAGGVTVNVDLSRTYLEWGKRNYKLNGLDTNFHGFIESDILEFVDKCLDQFDIIICDPPTFSNSKKLDRDFDLQRDHAELLIKLKKNLSPNGVIYFSGNKKKFKIDEIDFLIENITDKTLDEDFKKGFSHFCFKLTHH